MLALAAPAAAFSPSDPLASKQWYLAANHAYDMWAELPALAPVKIAIIDSGIDGGHPELVKHVAAARSFVGGKATVDTQGHGTFVALRRAGRPSDDGTYHLPADRPSLPLMYSLVACSG